MTLAEPSQNSKHNWPAFWAAIEGNACSPTMVWNDDTRRELVTKLKQEGHSFDQRRKKKGDAEWDWQSYEIQYASLSNQLLIGKYYVRLLIPALRGDTCSVEEPLAYLLDLYNHAVVEDDPRQKLLILQCMTTLFERYKETISVVPIMPYLVWLLKEDHYHVEWRQQVLIFLRSLFSLSQNIINFVYAGGIRVLLYHLNLCHSQEKDFQGKPLHPPSLAKFCLLLLEVAIGTPVGSKRLASPECFQYIVQALLLERFEVVDLTIKLVSKILDDHVHLVPTLYSTGIFSFIMAALRTACTPKIIHFLKTYHDAQLAFQMPPSLARLPSPSERPPSSYSSSSSSLLAVSPRRERGQKVSYLSYYLPQSMISLLRGEDEKAFASLLKSKCMRSNVIWGEQHLVLLTEHVNSELEEFRRQLGRSPNARFIYTEPRQVLYPDLEEEIIVDNVYLTFFNSDLECPLPHPVQFMKKLLQLTAQSDHSESYFHTVLCAQGVFLQRFPEDETVTKYQGFESLYALISRDQDSLSAQLLSAEALDLIYKLISLPKGGSDNLQTAVRLNIIGTLGELLHKVTSFRDPSQRSQKLLSNLMRVVNMVVEHQDSTVGISQHPTLVQDLVSLLFRPTSSSSASSPEDEELLLSLLYCIKKMAGARALQTRIVESGGFLYLLLLLLPTEDYQQEQEQEDGSVVEMNEAKTIDTPQSSRLSTKESLSSSRNSNYGNTATVMIELVKALKSLVFGVLQHESHQPQTLAANPALQSLLTQILTPSLYHAFLSEPEEQFAAQINTTVESPDLIWNKDMRTELYQWLLDQADRLQSPSSSSSPVSSIYASSLSSSTGSLILPSLSSTGGETPRTLRHNHPRWLARNIQFEYDYLKRELIVQNLYIRPFAQRPDFVVPNPVDFVIAVLDALEDRAEQLVQKLLNDSAAAASAPNKNNKRKTSKSSESEDSTDDTDSDSDSDSEDGSSSSVSSKGPSFSHIMKEVTHLTKALHHVLAQQSGERESQALVSLLASLSQTIALFSLLQMQNNTTSLTQTEKGEALVATLRVLRVMASSASCAPVVLEHLNTLHWVINSCSFCPEAQALVFTLLADLIVQGGAPVVQSIDRSGMIVSMLAIFCGSPIKETRLKVAQVIGTLATSPELGPKMTSLFVTFFTSNFEEAILNAKQEPSKLIELYDGDNEAPQLFWNNETRKDMVNTLIREINPIIQSLAKQQKPLQPQEGKEKAEEEGYVWDSSTLAKRYKRPAMEREFTVGGYYIRFFNNDPLHYVKSINADTFLEAIVAFIKQNCDTAVSSSSGKKDKEKKKKKKKEKEEGATTTTELSSVMEEKLSMCWEAVVGLLTARSAYKKHAGVRELVPFVIKQLQQALERFDSTEIGSLYYFMLDAFLILARKKDIEKELDPVEVLRIVLSFCHKNPKRHSTILLFLQDYVEADSANAARLKAAGGLFYLLEILFSPNTKHQEEVVTVLLAMVSDKKVGEATTEFIQRFFSHKQASAVAENRYCFVILFLFCLSRSLVHSFFVTV
ncbi:DnaJ subfamily C member 13 [Balamuthia mandrillaris]